MSNIASLYRYYKLRKKEYIIDLEQQSVAYISDHIYITHFLFSLSECKKNEQMIIILLHNFSVFIALYSDIYNPDRTIRKTMNYILLVPQTDSLASTHKLIQSEPRTPHTPKTQTNVLRQKAIAKCFFM